MFSEIASAFSGKLLPYTPYSNISDRAAWEALDPEWKTETVLLGQSFLGFEWPYLSASDFLEFFRTGNRVHFEDKMFSKRHALNALILAECVENQGRFLPAVIDGIFSICDENAWNLPAHNSYERDCPQLPLPDLSDPVLDLFACETGAVLATASYLLSPVLDDFSPFLTKRIRYELERRIFIPYQKRHFWWMGDGISPMNNWTIWCTQNVLLSAFLTDTDDSLRRFIFHKACQSTDFFLAEYGQDGCCDEGAQYYRHAGLCLFLVLSICDSVTGGAFRQLFSDEKIRNIASYIYRVHVADQYYINFADCSPIAGRCSAREYLFAKLTDQENMMRFAAKDCLAGQKNALLLPTENNLFYRLLSGFTAAEIKAFDCSCTCPAPNLFYPSVGLFASRDERLFLAVKAGDNADSHNHNDVGSFTVYKDGLPVFIDIGVESYTKKTFSPQRYEIWTMQSAWHNLPSFDGVMQKDGEHYHAADVSCSLEDSSISMDIAPAYPSGSPVASYRRRARLYKEEKIHITDTFSFRDDMPHQVVLSLITYEKPKIISELSERQEISIPSAADGKDPARLFLSGGRVAAIEEIPITDARLAIAWKHPIYRILITPLPDSRQFDLEIR
ncbi:MAG: heparinase II/III family protein [Eisenbergiella sp.]